MKLPVGDNDLTEDEIEGLVSRSITNDSPSRTLRSGRSSTWMVSSRSIGKSKKVLFLIGFLVLVVGLVGLSSTNSEAASLQPNDDPSPPEYIKGGDDNDGGDTAKENKVDEDNAANKHDSPKHSDSAEQKEEEETEEDQSDSSETEIENKDESESKDESETSTEDNNTPADEEHKDNEIKTEDKGESKDQGEGETEGEAGTDEVDAGTDTDEEHDDDNGAWPVHEEDDAKREAEKEALIEQWGKWHFWDGDPDSRPQEDYMAKFPNRDCTFDDFPDTAWQGDAVYVNHMLDSASELVARAKEAIYTEYGYGPKDELSRDQLKARMMMFRLHSMDLEDNTVTVNPDHLENGGWTTRKSLDGLSRRLIHAMMANDSFTIVLGGDSAAAGHGNHFLQSYMMQMYKILNPIFERVGVKLIIRNLAQGGGLGTLQNSLGSKSIYGDDLDIIVWDSAMTETDKSMIDLFYRQALIGGKRAPVLFGGPFDLLKALNLNADADVFYPGTSLSGIKETTDEDQAAALPFAARYIKCEEKSKGVCDANKQKFRAQCWIDRDDVTPPTTQKAQPDNQDESHPGFRIHQLKSRTMAMTMLIALENAIDTWSEITIVEGHPLEDEHWHMTKYYDNIRNKALNLDSNVGACSGVKDYFPERICTTPLNGRTEFTPRANPNETSLRSIMKPTPSGFVPDVETKMLYDGPDVTNPLLLVPEGEIDVEAIVANRRKLSEVRFVNNFEDASLPSNDVSFNTSQNLRVRNLEEIKAGKGWQAQGLPGHCDGTAASICGRLPTDDCLLYGHQDFRGGILGNAFSGWFAVNVPAVSKGIIIIKVDRSHTSAESSITEGWTKPNNGEYKRALADLPEDFLLDYAIDGEVKTLNLEQFSAQLKTPQTAVETITVMDDPDMKESKDIEVAFRMRNCGRDCNWAVTHIFWA